MSKNELIEKLRSIDSNVWAGILPPSEDKHHKILDRFVTPQPSLEQKVRAATWIAAMGVNHSGIGTQATLMWPYREFNEAEVARFAANTLADALTVLLQALPPQQIDKLWTDQDERLSFVLEPGLPDDKNAVQ